MHYRKYAAGIVTAYLVLLHSSSYFRISRIFPLLRSFQSLKREENNHFFFDLLLRDFVKHYMTFYLLKRQRDSGIEI